MIDPNIDFGYDEKRSRDAGKFADYVVQGILLTVIGGIVLLAVAKVVG